MCADKAHEVGTVETWSLRTGVSSVKMSCDTVDLIRRPCLSPHFITKDEYAEMGDTTGAVADALRSLSTEGVYPRDHSVFAALAWMTDANALERGLAPSPTLLWEAAEDAFRYDNTTVLLPVAVKAPQFLPTVSDLDGLPDEIRFYVETVDRIWDARLRKSIDLSPELLQAQQMMASWSWLLVYAELRGMSVACSGALLAMDGDRSIATLVVRASPRIIAGLYTRSVLKSLSDEDKPE